MLRLTDVSTKCTLTKSLQSDLSAPPHVVVEKSARRKRRGRASKHTTTTAVPVAASGELFVNEAATRRPERQPQRSLRQSASVESSPTSSTAFERWVVGTEPTRAGSRRSRDLSSISRRFFQRNVPHGTRMARACSRRNSRPPGGGYGAGRGARGRARQDMRRRARSSPRHSRGEEEIVTAPEAARTRRWHCGRAPA